MPKGMGMDAKNELDLAKYVRRKRGGFIRPERLREEYPGISLADLQSQAARLEKLGVLQRTKSSKMLLDGQPPLLSCYRIIVEKPEPYDTSDLEARIAESPWIVRHPDDAREHDQFLRQLSRVLSGDLDVSGLDHREAGYLLANDEHAFDEEGRLKGVLKGIGVTLEEVGVHVIPYPPTLETYARDNGPIIVSENVGPYNRLRRIARSRHGALVAFGFAPSAVVLGNGNYATRPRFVTDVVEQVGLQSEPHIVYWGDVDRAGLSILAGLARSCEAVVKPWAPAYHAMLGEARKRPPRTSMDLRGVIPDLSCFAGVLDSADLVLLDLLVSKGCIVPQEALQPEAYANGSLACR